METRIPMVKTLHVIKGGADRSYSSFSIVGGKGWIPLSAAVALDEVDALPLSELSIAMLNSLTRYAL